MDTNPIGKPAMPTGVDQPQATAQTSVRQTIAEPVTTSDNESRRNTVNDSYRGSLPAILKKLETLRDIEMIHDSLNQQAKDIRETNEAISKLSQQLAQMKEGLDEIIKHFPAAQVEDGEPSTAIVVNPPAPQENFSSTALPAPIRVFEKAKREWGELFDQKAKPSASGFVPLEIESSETPAESTADKPGKVDSFV